MYKTFGFYYEGLISVTKKGKTGAEEIQQMMSDFITTNPELWDEDIGCDSLLVE
jgi:phosphoglucomutase